jgi:hypothetical protein
MYCTCLATKQPIAISLQGASLQSFACDLTTTLDNLPNPVGEAFVATCFVKHLSRAITAGDDVVGVTGEQNTWWPRHNDCQTCLFGIRELSPISKIEAAQSMAQTDRCDAYFTLAELD